MTISEMLSELSGCSGHGGYLSTWALMNFQGGMRECLPLEDSSECLRNLANSLGSAYRSLIGTNSSIVKYIVETDGMKMGFSSQGVFQIQ